MALSVRANVTQGPASGHVYNRRAIELARGLDEPAPFFMATGLACSVGWGLEQLCLGVQSSILSN